MSTSSSYDAVILGTRLAGLLSGALLAKRGFRVLCVGQGELPPTYQVAGRALPRRPFAFLAAHAPTPRHVMSELSLNQLFRRKAVEMDPVLQLATPGVRFDLPPERPLLDAEIAREFPTVRRPIEDVLKSVERVGGELDRLFDRDLAWPPASFLEKREFARATAHGGFELRGRHWDPLAELPPGHPFRCLVEAPAFFAAGMDPAQLPGTATCRLLESWWRGAVRLDGGEPWLREALIEKIRAHSGDVRPRESVASIVVRRGKVDSVHLATSEEHVGAGAVVVACDVQEALRRLPDRGALAPIFERRGEPQPRWFRYTLNVVVAAEAVPQGMARDVFYVADPAAPLGDVNGLHIEAGDITPAPEGQTDERVDERLLTIEALLPRRDVEGRTDYLDGVRERILDRLGELIPFVAEHLRFVDSPHDGRDAELWPSRDLVASEEPWNRGAHTMDVVHGYPVRKALGLSGLPMRTPIRGLLLGGPHCMPALGAEGAFITAEGVARILTAGDRRKAWVRRGWTKVEL